MSAHGIPSVLSVCAEEVGGAYASGPGSPGYAPPVWFRVRSCRPWSRG